MFFTEKEEDIIEETSALLKKISLNDFGQNYKLGKNLSEFIM